MSKKQSIDPIELQRLHDLTIFERAARQQGYKQIAGIDEAGRGPLAGPVVAAACIIPEGVFLPGVDDSKKLTPQKRQALFELIKGDTRIQFGVGIVSHTIIDAINIYQAAMEAMRIAVANLPMRPDYLLVDGLKLDYPIPSQKIIKGDQLSQSIAAASIIAKETRDKIMLEYHQEWPYYGFNKHKGYATAFHRDALREHGPCTIHRLSFEWRKVESELVVG
jgi:ribonuclease HII